MNPRYSIYIIFALILTALFSCADMVPTKEVRLVDSLNGKAYDFRFINLDSSYKYARTAYRTVNLYKSGQAEACNNMGFCAFMLMDYDRSETLYKEVFKLTKNELELLIADIGLMKLYQRTAMNKEFYDYRNSAVRRMKRIREEGDMFADRHETRRLNYAYSEFFLVSTLYYYFLQQRSEASLSFNQISEEKISADINQLLYYQYIKGTTSLLDSEEPDDKQLKQFDDLYNVWRKATQQKYSYFEGNALQGLANLMTTPREYEFFLARRGHILNQFHFPVDSLLPLRLAQSALKKVKSYNDLYQIGNTYVTIGKYLNGHGCYTEALDSLTKALNCVNRHHFLYYHGRTNSSDRLTVYLDGDTTFTGVPWITEEKVKTVPEWIGRIREQLSVSYAGMGLRKQSNYNRNIYLDILTFTRQDKEFESRFQSLQAGSKQLTAILFFVIIGLVLVVILFIVINKRSKQRNEVDMERLQKILLLCRDITSSIPMNEPLIQKGIDSLFGKDCLTFSVTEEGKASFQSTHKLSRENRAFIHILEPYVQWAADNEQMTAILSDERSQLDKQRYIYEQHIAGNKRQNLIKKSCLAIVTGITPYIDRILNEVHKLTDKGFINDPRIKKEKYQYIDELVTKINEYNDILALWIKMKQGTLSLNIETFHLNELFELVGKGHRAFEMKKQKLHIEPTLELVKADRALTLFMINTLAENARKYTPEGGNVKIYAHSTDEYVEISVEDDGPGISPEDVSRIIGEKIYDSSEIGMKNAVDPEELKENKGSGFGLMNCKGIIDKYRKTNELFRVCLFNIESEPGKGSRFFFRLPLGVRKTLSVLLLVLLPFGMMSCDESIPSNEQLVQNTQPKNNFSDSIHEELLSAASDYANAAFFANVDQKPELALQYADSAIDYLNQYYREYAPQTLPRRYMSLVGEGTPAEIQWWNSLFTTDFHVILDIRNEAAVAFLALKQLDAYYYNNAAYAALYKLQGEDQSLEGDCKLLERSTTNKTVGILICFIMLAVAIVGYYILYIRKRWQNRMNLEQILEINRKVFAASLLRPQEESAEALQREEDTLKEIPQCIVDEAFDSVNELLTIDLMGIAVYNEAAHRLEYASKPFQKMPEIVQKCFDNKLFLQEEQFQALPLMVEVGEENQCVGVLCLERREGTERAADHLLFELVARYVAIVVFNAVVKMAMKYRDIESAHEEARRASWEDGMLHVQNMVLDNCLSTIKHETVYYPNKIKQIINKLNSQQLNEEEEKECVIAITELIEYYKGIFTILSSCASRQLEEVTFRRTVISVQDLFATANKYIKKVSKNFSHTIEWQMKPIDAKVIGDINQLRFLLENLIDEALTVQEEGVISLEARKEDEYVRFFFTDTRRDKSVLELNQLFYPNLDRMTGPNGELIGTEYLVCKQIIRDHDEFAGRRGCRINAEPAENGGFTVYFTIPRR